MKRVAVIPSRYEPARLASLLDAVAPDCDLVLVMDNGHEPRFASPHANVRVVPTEPGSIYAWWNQGWQLAREEAACGPVDVAILNDDIRILPGTLPLLSRALRSQADVGAVYPDRRALLSAGLPARLDLTIDRDPVGSREMTGYAFMFRGELPLPPFDEGYGWWYGDTQFDESVRLAGYGVAQVNGLPVEHESDAERDGWARRPELREAVVADGQRWEALHAEIHDGRWVPRTALAGARVVILVPRRRDNGHRDRLWAWCRARWERELPDVPIFEGHHDDGPFNRSAAINRAAAEAGAWDVAVVVDSDVFLKVSQVRSAIARAFTTGRVTWGHRRWRGLSEADTMRVLEQRIDFGPQLQRHDMDLLVERTNPVSWSCCIAISRAVWDDLGGFDERFRGWGFEDMAFQSVVCGLYGHERIEGDVYHLWHPRSGERIQLGQNRGTATPEYVTNAQLGRRYMVALRRDHGQTERLDVPSAEHMARDIENLERDDAKFAAIARALGLPDWSSWWPTLEELRDGAKAMRLGPGTVEPTITVVVTTGGAPENWPERSGYLRRSLASLVERVTGPIVQRVVYSDWDAAFRAELSAIAVEHGFYVVGEGHHGYTGARRRLWKYLATRARGEFVFAAEDDFVYERDVDLGAMVATLREAPHLRQLALLRAPYYPRELEAGSVVPPDAETIAANGHSRIEHRDYFTANPSLFRRSLTDTPWPSAASSERVFGDLLLRDRRTRFAYWGDGSPWITHVGAVRAGEGY